MWQPKKDSNPHKQSQSYKYMEIDLYYSVLLCYVYSIKKSSDILSKNMYLLVLVQKKL